jgi:predicted enzyme related to lactoylglutathione lyase
MAQPSVHGRFIWRELMTDDTAAAADFYATVVGWQVHAPVHPNGDYRVFAVGKREVAGAMSLPEPARQAGARPHWLPYIGADDVDAVVSRVEQLGGKVLRAATDVQDIGRYAVLADPQGAAFGVYHPRRPVAAPAGQPQRGEFSWQELATSDFEAGFRFYAELFGWETLQRMDMGPAGTYLIFGLKGMRLGGIYKHSAQTQAQGPYWLSYISVPDVDTVAGTARAHGARVVTGPMDVPDEGRIVQLLDGSGVLFAIHSRKAAATQPAAAAPKPPKAVPPASKPKEAAPGSASSGAATAAPPAASVKAPPAATASPAAKPAARPLARPAPKKAPRKAAKKAKKAKKKVAAKTTRRAAKKAAPKVAKKKRPVKKSAKRAVRRGAAKSARKAARKANRKVAKKTRRARRGK